MKELVDMLAAKVARQKVNLLEGRRALVNLEVSQAERILDMLKASQPEGALPASWLEQWDIFCTDYNRYANGDAKMPFQLLRESLSAFIAETQDMIESRRPQK